MEEKEQELSLQDEDVGIVRISPEVVIVIAHQAAMDTEGVSGMSAGIAENISQALGRKGGSKGIKVDMTGGDVTIDFYLIVDYGSRIPDVAWRVQENVKKTVEEMTGLSVKSINIHVQGVNFEKKS